MFNFTIQSSSNTHARTGIFTTPHGPVKTPCFMPCGTKGTVKTLTPEELDNLGCEIMLCNTYHLMLRPGGELIEKQGGLHKWINWQHPILTDSGGFQVFSLSTLNKIDDDGVTFKSHIDGSTHRLTPEKSIQIQEQLGADIIMAFDECAPADADYTYTKKAMERTHEWLLRSLKAQRRTDQLLIPIIQGGTFTDLRKESTKFIVDQNTAAIAIGGVAVGEGKEKMWEAVEEVVKLLPRDKPIYLMGVGEPEDILRGVSMGIDMFDCVIPTRLARHGSFWDARGKRINLRRAEFINDEKPLDSACVCYTCTHFSRSYLHHLMREREMLGSRLLTLHNLHFIFSFMKKIQELL